jgi:methionyl-tRNA formyltransferase
MRIVFFGTPDFAKKPLERLYKDGHDIVGVFTQPDKPRNRGMKLSYSPVKEAAIQHGTPVFQPSTLRDGTALEALKELGCDIIAVVAYGKLFPPEILEFPPFGCVNIHGSLLPKYRGAAPIQWAVLNGEKETGVSSMYMAEEMDAGDVLFTRKTLIGDNETAGELYDRLAVLGAELLSGTIAAIAEGKAVRMPQNHDEATFAPLLSKGMSPIDWFETAYMIKCKVRGLNPWPVATTELNGAACKVFSVDISGQKAAAAPGEVVSTGESGIEIACADGSVFIKELQAPGGKRMPAADYIRGHSQFCGGR